MRILHTSDWHLGQSLHQYDRVYEHERFLNWLLETMVSEQVEGLVIAGDIFDNANPSAAAQKQLYRFITESLRQIPHLNIVITAGNHDSAGRLEAPSPFLDIIGVKVVGHIRNGDEIDWNRVVVPLKNRKGETVAWCIAMPFLRPSDLPLVENAADPYLAGIESVYKQAFEEAITRRRPGQAVIAIGHCHLTGGVTSEESERKIVIGGAEALSDRVFDSSIAYVALGHLHLAQVVGGNPTRRYCGSPLPMSFSEINYPHQVIVFDLEGETATNIRDLRVPRAVDLLRIPKVPATLDEVVAELSALELGARPEQEWPYLQVRVQLTRPEPSLRVKIEAAIADKPVRLARIETSYARREETDEGRRIISFDEFNSLKPEDFFIRLYKNKYGGEVPNDIFTAFNELINSQSGSEV